MRRRSVLKGISGLVGSGRAILSGLFSAGVVSEAAKASGLIAASTALEAAEPPVLRSQAAPPNFADYATVEALANGENVYSLDNIIYIYGAAPDLMPGVVIQEGNTRPHVKIKPKKSWEIKWNLLGSNTAQHPRTPENDFQTFLPIHLIDGHHGSLWCSFGSIKPGVHPEWIRIDLPIESTVASVALVLSNQYYPGSNFGRSLPKELTVKLSRDAWHWESVYERTDVDIDVPDRLEIKFAARRAKQIWIIGNNFTKPLGLPNYGFSIGGLEVRDPAGSNLALVSRGAGVTVSSTNFTHSDNRISQNAVWGPLHYDTGTKWIRQCGGSAGPYQWCLMEKKKGRYQVDAILDRWLSDAHRCGVNLIMGLDMTQGNPLYQNPAQQTDWLEARWKGLPNTAAWVDQTPDMLAAWLRFVDFLVRHFKDRAYIWELGNEWSGCGWDDQIVERYMKIFDRTYEAVKKADPAARIMPGAINAFAPDAILTLLGGERRAGMRNGKFVANGGNYKALETSTLALAENAKVKDGTISVDAMNRGQFGIVCRYAGPQHFLLGAYGTCLPGYGAYIIYIAERVGDSWEKSRITAKDIGYPFSLNLQLKMHVEGTQATLTISDGIRQESITHGIRADQLNREGSVGLVQLTGGGQTFGNFRIRDSAGSEILREEFNGEQGALPSGWRYVYGPHTRNPIAPGLAQKIHGLSWHPTNPPDAAYFGALREMQKDCRELGFKGRFYADELFFFFSYPSTPISPMSELQQGIATMVSVVGHSGLDTLAETQILNYTGYSGTDSNCRQSGPSEVLVSSQPSVMYYMWRTLATVMDDFHPAEFQVKFDGGEKFVWFTFQRHANEKLVGVWMDGGWMSPEVAEVRSAVTLPGIRISKAWVVDLLNGTEQQLLLMQNGEDTVIPGIRVKNYPTMIRFID